VELERHPQLKERVERLESIGGVGRVTALTWALEVGDPRRLSSNRKASSYCGLTSAERSSGDKVYGGPLSKQRNKHLQRVLIEAAHLAPSWNPELKRLYEKECQRGNPNRATIVVARKLVAYLLAVDKSGRRFEPASAEAESNCKMAT
jgi:transposase